MPSSLLTKLLRNEKDHERNYKGGTRGGKDQFNWEIVKDVGYKNRECYLGYSTKIGHLDKAGKWKRNDWYKGGVQDAQKTTDEKRREIRLKEQEAMDIALGLKRREMEEPKVKVLSGKDVEIVNKKIKSSERDFEVETVGLGFAATHRTPKGPSKVDLGKNNFQLPEKFA